MKLFTILATIATAYGSARHHHSSSSSTATSYTPSVVVSTYTVATLVPVSSSSYEPYEDSLSLNDGGLAPVTVTVTTLVPMLSTVTVTAGGDGAADALNATTLAPINAGPTTTSSAGSSDTDSDDSSSSADPDSSDDNSAPILTSWSTSTYKPQMVSSTKKHHFW